MCASAHAFSVVTGGGERHGVVLATDDDTVTCIEIFTDGSSLIPKAWNRVAICDNQRIAVIGMFFGEVTVDSGHHFFCGANNVQIGA